MAIKKNNFEEQLNELQEIVNKLESGNVPLEDALSELEKKLNDAEQTVAKLVDKDGNEKALDPQNASAPEEE